MTPNQFDRMLGRALKEKAPRAHRQMRRNGTLKQYVRRLTGQTLQRINDEKLRAGERVSTQGSPAYLPDAQDRIQTLNSEFKQIEEIGVQQAIEEIEALETTDSPRECESDSDLGARSCCSYHTRELTKPLMPL